jgi:branched-chain amino acid transport system ATP-binding protein
MMLDVTSLGAGYGRIPILLGVQFSVAEGERVGLWGHNGMGKTTLLRAIMGYLAAAAGTISFSGMDITKMPTHARAQLGIGLVPQGRQIPSGLTVLENLRMGNAALAAADKYKCSLASSPSWIARAATSQGASSNCWHSLAACVAIRK